MNSIITIKEFKMLTESLWSSVKVDLLQFSSIKIFVIELSEINYSDFNEDKIVEIQILVKNIDYLLEEIVKDNSTSEIIIVNKIFTRIKELLPKINRSEIENVKRYYELKNVNRSENRIFIGHGRNKLWARLELFLTNDLKLKVVTYESVNHTSENIVNIISSLLSEVNFAILILTGEDETLHGKTRARQNVIHEAGLFQGKLGFNKVIILKQAGIEAFTNISGLQYIGFNEDKIETTFYEIQRKLKKEGII